MRPSRSKYHYTKKLAEPPNARFGHYQKVPSIFCTRRLGGSGYLVRYNTGVASPSQMCQILFINRMRPMMPVVTNKILESRCAAQSHGWHPSQMRLVTTDAMASVKLVKKHLNRSSMGITLTMPRTCETSVLAGAQHNRISVYQGLVAPSLGAREPMRVWSLASLYTPLLGTLTVTLAVCNNASGVRHIGILTFGDFVGMTESRLYV